MNRDALTEYFAEYSVRRRDPAYSKHRDGQIAWNLLWEMEPDLTKEIVRSELDPFFDDSRLPAFFEYITNIKEK